MVLMTVVVVMMMVAMLYDGNVKKDHSVTRVRISQARLALIR